MPSRALAGYLVFALAAVAVTATVALLGGAIALDRGGNESAEAWRLGCAACLAASLAAGLLVAAGTGLGMAAMTVTLGSMLLRIAILGLAGAAVFVLLAPEVQPYLLAVAISYLALLVVDTGYALWAARRGGGGMTGIL